jgi:hypothetical protein
MKRWLCVIGLALSLGCASAVVRPYIGDQQAWPTASGSIVSTNYSLPVFTSLPPVPYDVLAEVRISSPFYAQPEEHHLPLLVRKAKQLGADALVFVQGKIFFSTNYGPRNGAGQDAGEQKAPTLTTVNTFNPDSFATEVNILAIRWTDEAPAGLPPHHKTAPVLAAAPVEAPPAAATPAPTQSAPSAEPPKADSSAPAAAPSSSTTPATSPTQ